MALIFSEVEAIAGDKKEKFLVSGFPRTAEALRGWTAFENFKKNIGSSQIEFVVTVHRYGEGEDLDATPEEVAYMYQRVAMRDDFIDARTELVERFEFSS